MCANYVSAELPPGRFWEITPRLYATEIDGALQRIKRERALAWEAATIPLRSKVPSLSEFVGEKQKPVPASMLGMQLRAASRGMRTISLAEYRRTRRKS